MLNTSKVMKALGFPDGSYNRQKDYAAAFKKRMILPVGKFEKSEKIDTTEEFLTIFYYSDIDYEKLKSKQVLYTELPDTEEGALKLGAMWLKKRIDTGNFYNQAIDFICKESKVKKNDILNYYRDAITAKIDSVVTEVLSHYPRRSYEIELKPGQKTVNAIDLVKAYFIYPSMKNYKILYMACYTFGTRGVVSSQDMVCFDAMMKILHRLSPGLHKKIFTDIKKRKKYKITGQLDIDSNPCFSGKRLVLSFLSPHSGRLSTASPVSGESHELESFTPVSSLIQKIRKIVMIKRMVSIKITKEYDRNLLISITPPCDYFLQRVDYCFTVT